MRHFRALCRALFGATIFGLVLAVAALGVGGGLFVAASAAGGHDPAILGKSGGAVVAISKWRSADDHKSSGSRRLGSGNGRRADRACSRPPILTNRRRLAPHLARSP